MARVRLADEIRMHLFSADTDTSLEDLEDLDMACNRLESSMDRMSQVHWGCALLRSPSNLGNRREVGDDRVPHDVRFDHSWTSVGPGPRPGWY